MIWSEERNYYITLSSILWLKRESFCQEKTKKKVFLLLGDMMDNHHFIHGGLAEVLEHASTTPEWQIRG